MKKVSIALGLVLLASSAHAKTHYHRPEIYFLSAKGQQEVEHDYPKIAHELRLTDEDEEFVDQAADLVPQENLNVEGYTFYSTLSKYDRRGLTQEDKQCFAQQVRAFQDAKDFFKSLPVVVRMEAVEYWSGSGTASDSAVYITFTERPRVDYSMSVGYSPVTKTCSIVSADQMKKTITQAVERVREEAVKKEDIKRANESIVRSLMPNNKPIQANEADLRDPRLQNGSIKPVSNLMIDGVEKVFDDTDAGSAM